MAGWLANYLPFQARREDNQSKRAMTTRIKLLRSLINEVQRRGRINNRAGALKWVPECIRVEQARAGWLAA